MEGTEDLKMVKVLYRTGRYATWKSREVPVTDKADRAQKIAEAKKFLTIKEDKEPTEIKFI